MSPVSGQESASLCDLERCRYAVTDSTVSSYWFSHSRRGEMALTRTTRYSTETSGAARRRLSLPSRCLRVDTYRPAPPTASLPSSRDSLSLLEWVRLLRTPPFWLQRSRSRVASQYTFAPLFRRLSGEFSVFLRAVDDWMPYLSTTCYRFSNAYAIPTGSSRFVPPVGQATGPPTQIGDDPTERQPPHWEMTALL